MDAELDEVLAGTRAAQAALDEWLAGLPTHDPAEPSRLPGWTLGHVLTHLARNADSNILRAAGDPAYPGGGAQRDGDIEAGAGRPWEVLLSDLADAHGRLSEAWERVSDWSALNEHLAPPRRLDELPFFRWREVEVHRADLGLGYTFDDMPQGYVRRDLHRLTMQYRASKPIGLTQLPAAAATAPPAVRLAWLLGRADLDGVPPAGVF